MDLSVFSKDKDLRVALISALVVVGLISVFAVFAEEEEEHGNGRSACNSCAARTVEKPMSN